MAKDKFKIAKSWKKSYHTYVSKNHITQVYQMMRWFSFILFVKHCIPHNEIPFCFVAFFYCPYFMTQLSSLGICNTIFLCCPVCFLKPFLVILKKSFLLLIAVLCATPVIFFFIKRRRLDISNVSEEVEKSWPLTTLFQQIKTNPVGRNPRNR